MPVSAAIAFFDLDLTLLEVNTASLWVRREVRLGHISRWSALRAAAWLGMYELGVGRLEDAIQSAARTLAGKEEAIFRQRTLDFWEEQVSDRIRPGGRAAVRAHQGAGDATILLTSSSNYLGQLAVDALGLDGMLTNRFVVEDGRYTGLLETPICYGSGKLLHAQRCADAAGVSLADCSFYTDSMSDVSVLKAVGNPVAVHPDPRLRREANRQDWPVVDWSEATA
mgnify:CR=1 FL=1